MENKHIFSKSYAERKEKVQNALRCEEIAERNSNKLFAYRIPLRVLASVAVISALTLSVYAAAQWIDFRMEKNGDEVRVYAELNETGEVTSDIEDKPLRSWNAYDDEIMIRLSIPDLPSDMSERDNTNGKYFSEDSARAMTVSAIDLRRSDLDEIIENAGEAKQLDAGGKTLYVIKSNAEAYLYDRTAFVLLEEEDLVLKMLISYGITDDELLRLASTLTVEETDDELLALPIINEVDSNSNADIPFVFVKEEAPIYETSLSEIGEAVRDEEDWYTATVNKVEVFDNINVLNKDCILRKDFVARFTDDSGILIPYNRTEVFWSAEEGEKPTKHFGDTDTAKKKLYVVTLTMDDVTMDDLSASDREEMLEACVNGFDLNTYTVSDGEINITYSDFVVDRKPEANADSCNIVYREYLGNNRWKLAYLIDEDIACGDLVLNNYTGNIYVKIP